MVAETVVVMAVGVDDDPNGQGSQGAEIGKDLVRLAMGDTGVDDEHTFVAEDDADVLVEELVARDEDAIAHLRPLPHRRSVRRTAPAVPLVVRASIERQPKIASGERSVR
jgi:hypothetical protein